MEHIEKQKILKEPSLYTSLDCIYVALECINILKIEISSKVIWNLHDYPSDTSRLRDWAVSRSILQSDSTPAQARNLFDALTPSHQYKPDLYWFDDEDANNGYLLQPNEAQYARFYP